MHTFLHITENMELYAHIQNGRIIPEYSSDYEKLGKIKSNTSYKVTIVQPRNSGFHKKFFAMLNMVYENQEAYNNPETLREELTKAAGYYTEVRAIDGRMERKADSISFASMDQLEFENYYKAVWDVVARWLNISDDDIRENLVSFM